MDRERVIVAEILRPRGNRGEVLAKSQSDVPARLETLKRARARLANGSDIAVEIERGRHHKGDWVLKFAGIDSISAAERFQGAELWLPLSERGRLPEGDFFQSDLIGCDVVEKCTGKFLGVVEGWQDYGGPLLMEVRNGDRKVLIPFAPSICEVDLPSNRIVVDLPEGLLDLE